MAQISLYYQTLLETKVSLLPEQINGNMDDHLLANLKAKIEKRVIDNGIVLKINRLIDYDYGMIDKTNFLGTVVYTVKYECFICSPTKNLEIICVLSNIVKGYLICQNGPIVIAIQFNNIDKQKFERNGNNIIHIKNKTPVKKGDHLKVSVISINNNLGEQKITTMCKLLNLADKAEIKRFENDQLLVTNGTIDDDQEFI